MCVSVHNNIPHTARRERPGKSRLPPGKQVMVSDGHGVMIMVSHDHDGASRIHSDLKGKTRGQSFNISRERNSALRKTVMVMVMIGGELAARAG